MGGWLDRWAKRAATAAPIDDPSTEIARAQSTAASPPSRRDFLKKAGLVGGVAWSIPVMSTVLAPAASASVGNTIGDLCTAPNVPGDTCVDGSKCSPSMVCGGVGAQCGSACFNSVCGSGTCGGMNATCTTNSNCGGTLKCGGPSGSKTCGGNGAVCGGNGDCSNGNCVSGICGNPTGTTCTANSQCANSSCAGRPGEAVTCGGPRATCTTNADCTFSNCAGGICGGTGATCTNEVQCAAKAAGQDCPGGVCKAYP